MTAALIASKSPRRSAPSPFANLRLTLCLTCAVLALLTTGPQPARATEARLIALGGVGDYIEDDRNVRRWYGSLLDYADLWALDSGAFGIDGYPRYQGLRQSGPAVGIHGRLDRAGTWGTFGLYADSRDHVGLAGSLASDTFITGKRHVLYGRAIGSVQTVVGVSFADAESETGGGSQPVVQHEFARTDLELGLRFDAAETLYLDLAGEVRRYGQANRTDGPLGDWSSGDRVAWGNIGLRGRAFYGLGDRTALVPVVEYLHEDRPASNDLAYTSQDLSGHLWRCGVGLNFLPDLDSLVFLQAEALTSEVNLQRDVHEPALEARSYHRRTWRSYNVILGWEKRFQSWLTVRASTGYRFVEDEVADWAADPGGATPAATTRSKRIPLSVGLGGHLGAWDLNLAVTSERPLTSPLTLPTDFFIDQGSATWVAVTLSSRFR